jgi:hypothetical protein
MDIYWPTWASDVLIIHPILLIWPHSDCNPFPALKQQLKGRHFASYAEVIAAAETWLDDNFLIFFEWLAKVKARG